MMSLILLLIVAVAAFNIVAMLVMVVTDKRTDIAILRTLGRLARARVMGIVHHPGAGHRLARGGARRGAGLTLALNVEPSCRSSSAPSDFRS